MSTPKEREALYQNVKSLLSSLSKINTSDLSRREQLTNKINFQNAVPDLEQMLDLIKQTNQRNLTRLPHSQLAKIKLACDRVNQYIAEINNFDINTNQPLDACTAIVSKIQNGYDEVMDNLILPLAFTATQATDFLKLEREAKGFHTNMQEEAKKLSEAMESISEEAGSALHAIKSQAAEGGVATNGQLFLDDSTIHSGDAKNWMIATIVMSVITLFVAGWIVYMSYNPKYLPGTTAIAIQYAISKIILMSTLSFGIYWCARNYKALKHNETLNKHRANALMTFRAFVEGADSREIKDAVLLQTSQAAFTNRPTGYENEACDTQQVNPVVEIMRRTMEKAE